MSTSKKKGLGRGLTALFGDQQEKAKKEDKNRNNGLKANIADLISIRQILKKLPFKDDVHILVHKIAPQYVDRNGGYTRILKRGYRDNDRASVSIIEFVESSAVVEAEAGEAEK